MDEDDDDRTKLNQSQANTLAVFAIQTAKIIQEKKKQKTGKSIQEFLCNVNVLLVPFSFFNTVCKVNFLPLLHKNTFSDVLYCKDTIKTATCGDLLNILFNYFCNFTQDIKRNKLFYKAISHAAREQ